MNFKQPINDKIDQIKEAIEKNLSSKYSQQILTLNSRLTELETQLEQTNYDNNQLY